MVPLGVKFAPRSKSTTNCLWKRRREEVVFRFPLQNSTISRSCKVTQRKQQPEQVAVWLQVEHKSVCLSVSLLDVLDLSLSFITHHKIFYDLLLPQLGIKHKRGSDLSLVFQSYTKASHIFWVIMSWFVDFFQATVVEILYSQQMVEALGSAFSRCLLYLEVMLFAWGQARLSVWFV